MRLVVIRFEGQGFFIAGYRGVQIAHLLICVAHVVMNLGILRHDLQGPAATFNRLIQSALIFECDTHVVVRFGIVGFDLQCPAVARDGIRQRALIVQQVAQIIVRLRVVWPDLYGLAISRYRLFDPPLVIQCDPHVVVVNRIVRTHLNCPLHQLDGGLMVIPLMSDKPEIVNRVGMIRIALKNLPIDRLRLIQPSRLMMPKGLIQCLVGIKGARGRGALGPGYWVRGDCLTSHLLPLTPAMIFVWAASFGLDLSPTSFVGDWQIQAHRICQSGGSSVWRLAETKIKALTPYHPYHPSPLAPHPSHPHLPVRRFDGSGKGLFITQRGVEHALAQGGPEASESFGILCKLNRFGDVVGFGLRDQFRQAEVGQDARTDAPHMSGSEQGNHRNPHPQGLKGCGRAVVGKGIECDIRLVVQGDMLLLRLDSGRQGDPLGRDAIFREEAKIMLPGPPAPQLSAFQQDAGTGNLAQNLGPCGHHVFRDFAQIIERREGELVSLQKREVFYLRRHIKRRIAMKSMGQADQGFAGKAIRHSFGIGDGVGDPIIDGVQPGGVWISEPRHLNRCGFAGKDQQTVVRGVPRQIHKDVNLVLMYLFGNLGIILSHRAPPMVGKFFDLLRHLIAFLGLRIGEYLHLGSVMGMEEGFNKVRAGVLAEIRGDIADAEPFVRGPVVPMGPDLLCQRLCVGVVPGEMLLKYRLRGVIRSVLQGKEHIAVGPTVVRLHLHRLSVTCNRLIKIPHVLDGVPQVVIDFHIVRPDFQCFPITVHRFPDFSLIFQHPAKGVIRIRIDRLQFQGLAATFSCLIQPAQLVKGEPHVVVRLGIVRLDIYGILIAVKGLFQLALIFEGRAHVVVCLGIIRIHCHRLAVKGHRLIESPQIIHDIAHVV